MPTPIRRALCTLGLGVAVVAFGAAPGIAASRGGDAQIARAATFVPGDFPAGFAATAAAASTSADNIRMAKGVAGCAPYIAVQKSTAALPQAQSQKFADDSRTVSNEVDLFKSERDARDALALYAKPSVVGCLKKLFEKQVRADPGQKGKLAGVAVTLARQDIAGLGDDRVVYEGTVVLTATDGSTQQLGIGNATVRIGRAIDAVTYTTSGANLTEILTPAIDASVARLRNALAGASS